MAEPITNGWTIAVFFVQLAVLLVTAVLFIWAILATRGTTKAVDKTTTELKGVETGINESVATLKEVQYSIQQQSAEVKETTNQIRETKDAIRQQSEAMYISQLWFKWYSPEIRESRVVFKELCINPSEGSGSLDSRIEVALDIPRFFDLVGNLVELHSIQKATALTHFGTDAAYYWPKYLSLMVSLSKLDFPQPAGKGYEFKHFQKFSGEATV